MNAELILIGFFMYVIGAVLGSFLLVTIMRGHNGKDWVHGRSVCENCGKELRWYELIPTVSFLIQGGKCRNCKAKIDPIHFISETGLGLIYLLLFILTCLNVIPSVRSLVIYLIAVTVLWTQVLSDKLYYEVHTMPVYITTLILSFANKNVILAIVLMVIATLLFGRDNFSSFGAGDIDILILMFITLNRGLDLINILFWASLICVILYYATKNKKKKKEIPFVPYLFIGFILTICNFRLI